MSQPPDSTRRTTTNEEAYDLLHAGPEFAELRRRFRRLVLPLTFGFLAWYFLYVLLATYAHAFMAHEVFGRINVGLLMGLAQFVSTFAIAWFYAHRAERDVDPLSAALHTRYVDLLAKDAKDASRGEAAP